jgi:hypothetical protein
MALGANSFIFYILTYKPFVLNILQLEAPRKLLKKKEKEIYIGGGGVPP